jgi:uncharacterized membrane protein YGL010W
MQAFDKLILDYTAYHIDTRNKLTHFVGVPMIVYAIFIATAWFRYIGGEGGPFASYATVLFIMLAIFYIKLNRQVGIAVTAAMFPLLWAADCVVRTSFSLSVKHFLVAFIVGWLIQFVGHWFEGRKPALFDNITQSLNAPIFLVTEVFFMLGGLKDLKAKVEATRKTKK